MRVEIAMPVRLERQPATLEAQRPVRARPGRHIDRELARRRIHRTRGTQHRIPEADRQIHMQVTSFDAIERVRLHHELDERIARLTELRLVALALEADRLPILHESRQLDRKLAPVGEYGCHLGGSGDLFDSDAERDIHIAHALRPSAATRTTSTSAGKSIAEQLAENVASAKTAATAKLEMVALPAATLAECGKWVALRAAFEAVEAWPPCFVDLAIVELPALRFIAEDFVGLADLGKTLLRLRIVGPLVGVEFLRRSEERRVGKECRSRWALDN